MIRDMNKLGPSRKSYSLLHRPPKLFGTKRKGSKQHVEIFEPYEENLPLEAGYYSFVLDQGGKFRVKRGNYSSHSSFVRGEQIGGAGQFRINRAGNVAEVFCRSVDYWLMDFNLASPTVDFVIQSFLTHHALEVSQQAIFHFKSGKFDSFHVSIEKQTVLDLEGRLKSLELEGQGTELTSSYDQHQRTAFSTYIPEPPTKLYGIHKDQMTIDLESEESQIVELGAPKSRLSVESPRLTSGKKAFVIDRDGWLIVGSGHQILSGGHPVGAAGQFTIESDGVVSEVNLNFSGHYRPLLSADYARFTFRTLYSHPLLKISELCEITGRKFDESTALSEKLRFTLNELLSDDPSLDESLEYAML